METPGDTRQGGATPTGESGDSASLGPDPGGHSLGEVLFTHFKLEGIDRFWGWCFGLPLGVVLVVAGLLLQSAGAGGPNDPINLHALGLFMIPAGALLGGLSWQLLHACFRWHRLGVARRGVFGTQVMRFDDIRTVEWEEGTYGVGPGLPRKFLEAVFVPWPGRGLRRIKISYESIRSLDALSLKIRQIAKIVEEQRRQVEPDSLPPAAPKSQSKELSTGSFWVVSLTLLWLFAGGFYSFGAVGMALCIFGIGSAFALLSHFLRAQSSGLRWGREFFDVFFVAGGIAFLGVCILHLQEAFASRSWFKTDGKTVGYQRTAEVITSVQHAGHVSRISSSPVFAVQYTYTVAGVVYDNNRERLGTLGFPDGTVVRDDADLRWVQAQARNKACVVYYDADDPAQSCLEPGMDAAGLAYWGIGSALFLSLGVIIHVKRKSKGDVTAVAGDGN
jgi:hypothetical protein